MLSTDQLITEAKEYAKRYLEVGDHLVIVKLDLSFQDGFYVKFIEKSFFVETAVCWVHLTREGELVSMEKW